MCACARPRKKARAAAGQRALQRPLQREAGEDCREEMHPGTTARHGTRCAARRGQHGAQGHAHASHRGLQPPRRGACVAQRDARAESGGYTGRAGRPSAEQTALRAARRSATSAPPGLGRCALSSDEQTDAPVHARQPTHTRRGRARPGPLRAPRPVLRPAPPGPPGSPARGGTHAHTVTTAGGLSDEEERGAAYAWLQRTAWECVSGDQRGSGPERTARTEGA